MSRVEFLPSAEAEISEAVRWYEEQAPFLGEEFLTAIDSVLQRIVEAPRVFPRVAPRTRRAVVRRFPYVVLYVVEPDRVLVTGLFHGHRDPRVWSDRLRESAVYLTNARAVCV